MNASGQLVPKPTFRKLRIFAIDPDVSVRFDTAVLNETTLAIPWESLAPGPVGEYIAVVDENEVGERIHDPVDLDRLDILAQDGLPPSDGNPQFHQQMVYAVAMRTIKNFEQALGRVVHWRLQLPSGSSMVEKAMPLTYRKLLKLYPHYTAERKAIYDPSKGLCFGYFESPPESAFPGTTVFMCLSQDVVAHELTHAILDGMNVRFEGLDSDVAVLMETIPELLALFQHLSLPGMLRHQIAATGGGLAEQDRLGEFTQQFGQAIGMQGALRDAIGAFDPATGKWRRIEPDPGAYRNAGDLSARARILIAAVFGAFLSIYKSRVVDLFRIASKGTGVLPEGSLHPDLVNRLAREASRSAQHVLEMLIRALDYMPSVEGTVGDYLRAIVTADYDVAPVDEANYRLAFVDAFMRWGIPSGVRMLSQDALLWPEAVATGEAERVSEFVRNVSCELTPWNLPHERQVLWKLLDNLRHHLHGWLAYEPAPIDLQKPYRLGPIDLRKPFEVQSFHPRERAVLAGDLAFQWVIKLVQESEPVSGARRRSDAEPRRLAGVTLLVDGDTGRVRYQIEKTASSARTRMAKGRPPIIGATTTTRPPTERRLRVFAFDPSLGIQLETAGINEVTIRVPWERDESGADLLKDGPVGEYLEVVDHDPASGCFYDPVDLNHSHILAQDGLPPSESNPQFHQQMVYAVAMRTIRNFEQALGRLALWRPYRVRGEDGRVVREDYVRRLRIYPHALREANAYYSPEKNAVLFGYFPTGVAEGVGDSPRLTVFTCLSHDIIVHEVTHALLDGMHRRFSEPSNPDVLAFHEAFADLVALLQHFSMPEVLRHQIASTRGDLTSQNRLGELAQQFGQAIGKRGALRNAIGETDPETGKWRRIDADPGDYQKHAEPHDRGAVLVAAVFDAFLAIYKGRIADLLRIASEGTGVLPEGNLHPDLVNRLTDEAARSARHVLEMCIRALDYCPAVDITFGDYLRAIVTADFEHDPVDEEHRRVAFVEAFRRRGIVPEGVQAFSVDGLLWRPASAAPDEDAKVIVDIVKSWAADITSWGISKSRQTLHQVVEKRRAALHTYLEPRLSRESVMLSGIDPELPFEVHSLRPSIRMGWEGKATFQWVIELTQRIPQYFGSHGETQKDVEPDYFFRGGCTLLVDAETGKVRYSIKKKLDSARKERQRHYALDEGNRNLVSTYFGRVGSDDRELFAMLHRL